MKLYAAIDLHSNNSVLVILDERDRTVLQRRLPNNLEQICQALCAHREAIEGIAVESTYNWYGCGSFEPRHPSDHAAILASLFCGADR